MNTVEMVQQIQQTGEMLLAILIGAPIFCLILSTIVRSYLDKE